MYIDRFSSTRYRAERYAITKECPFIANAVGRHPRVYPPIIKSTWRQKNARYRMDYARGVVDLVASIDKKCRPRLPDDYCLHVTELGLAIQKADPVPYHVKTTFAPLQASLSHWQKTGIECTRHPSG